MSRHWRKSRMSFVLAGLAALWLLPIASSAAMISVVDTASGQCTTAYPTITECHVSSVQGSLATGQAGDTFQITVLFRDSLDPARPSLLHLGPSVLADTMASMVSSGSEPFSLAVSMSLTDPFGAPINAPYSILAGLTTCTLGCGWSGAPPLSTDLGSFGFGNAIAGGVQFVVTTTPQSPNPPPSLQAGILGFSFYSDGAFYSLPEPASPALAFSLLSVLVSTRAAVRLRRAPAVTRSPARAPFVTGSRA